MSAAAWLLAALGVLLIWSGVKGNDPRAVLAGVFRPKASPMATASHAAAAAVSAAQAAAGAVR